MLKCFCHNYYILSASIGRSINKCLSPCNYLLIISLFSFINNTNLSAQKRIPYEFKKYTTSDGLPSNIVYSCLQDSRNYIWFFTQSGVARFDGRNFQNFSISDGLADNEILGGYEDTKGRLWFRSLNGKMSYYDLNTDKIIHYRTNALLKDLNLSSIILDILEDTEGNIWFQGEKNDSKILHRDNTIQKTPSQNIGDYDSCRLFKGEDDNIYSSSYGLRYIMRYNKHKHIFESISQNEFGKAANPKQKAIYVRYNGIYGADDVGIIYGNEKVQGLVIPKKEYNNTNIISMSVTDEKLWVTIDLGAYFFDKRTYKKLGFIPYSAPITTIIKDHEKNYWITTRNGVLMYPAQFQNINSINVSNKSELNQIDALTIINNGKILFSQAPNTIWQINNQFNLSKTTVQNNSIINNINQLKVNNNDLWIIGNNNFIRKFDNVLTHNLSQNIYYDNFNVLKHYRKFISGFIDYNHYLRSLTSVKNVYFAKNGAIYICSRSFIKIITNKNNNTIETKDYNQSYIGRYYAITEAPDGKIWYGGTNRLMCYDPVKDTNIVINNIEFESTINGIEFINNNSYFFSTSGAGVYYVQNGKITHNWQEKNGLSSNNCTRLIKQDNQNIWVATTKGVTRFKINPQDASQVELILYGGNNNHPATVVNDLAIKNDTLFLATNAGLYYFNVNVLTPQNNKPILKVLSPSFFTNNNQNTLYLDYGFFNNQNSVNFSFQTISFLNGEEIYYEYVLWRNNYKEQEGTFKLKDNFSLPLSALSAGDYTLVVRCWRGDNIKSDPIVLTFNVYDPIWKCSAAIFLYIIIGGFTVFYFFWYISKQNREQKRFELRLQETRLRQDEEILQSRQKQLALEQDALLARIDPHFVFNCLSGLMSFVYERNYDSLKKFLPRLARLIRNSLQLSKKDFIDIETEAKYLEDYLSLEKLRFEEKFDYHIQIDPSVDTQKECLPPLLLQIFVENAIKHAFKGMPHNKQGVININFEMINNTLLCSVKDNGIGIKKSLEDKNIDKQNTHQSLGVDLVKKRVLILNELFKTNYNIFFENNNENETGTKVVLTCTIENQ